MRSHLVETAVLEAVVLSVNELIHTHVNMAECGFQILWR